MFIKMGFDYNDFISLGFESDIEIIWKLIPIWGLVFIGLGLLSTILVIIPSLL
jgi:hypothetical protein